MDTYVLRLNQNPKESDNGQLTCNLYELLNMKVELQYKKLQYYGESPKSIDVRSEFLVLYDKIQIKYCVNSRVKYIEIKNEISCIRITQSTKTDGFTAVVMPWYFEQKQHTGLKCEGYHCEKELIYWKIMCMADFVLSNDSISELYKQMEREKQGYIEKYNTWLHQHKDCSNKHIEPEIKNKEFIEHKISKEDESKEHLSSMQNNKHIEKKIEEDEFIEPEIKNKESIVQSNSMPNNEFIEKKIEEEDEFESHQNDQQSFTLMSKSNILLGIVILLCIILVVFLIIWWHSMINLQEL